MNINQNSRNMDITVRLNGFDRTKVPIYNLNPKGEIQNIQNIDWNDPVFFNEQTVSMPIQLAQLQHQIQMNLKLPFQSIFFCPPIYLQDPTANQFSREQLLQLAYFSFTHLHNMLAETGFLIVHTFGENYTRFKVLLDEIFGSQNYLTTLIWQKFASESKITYHFPPYQYYQTPYDSILLYCKDSTKAQFHKFPPTTKGFFNPDNDPRGLWESRPLIASEKASNPSYTYTFQNGFQLTRKFRYAHRTIKKLEQENRIHFTHPKGKSGVPRVKIFYQDRLNQFEKTGEKGRTSNSLWCDPEEFGSLEEVWQENNQHPGFPNYPFFQSQRLYEKLLYITSKDNDPVLDCFDSSGVFEPIIFRLNRNLISINVSDGDRTRNLPA